MSIPFVKSISSGMRVKVKMFTLLVKFGITLFVFEGSIARTFLPRYKEVVCLIISFQIFHFVI